MKFSTLLGISALVVAVVTAIWLWAGSVTTSRINLRTLEMRDTTCLHFPGGEPYWMIGDTSIGFSSLANLLDGKEGPDVWLSVGGRDRAGGCGTVVVTKGAANSISHTFWSDRKTEEWHALERSDRLAFEQQISLFLNVIVQPNADRWIFALATQLPLKSEVWQESIIQLEELFPQDPDAGFDALAVAQGLCRHQFSEADEEMRDPFFPIPTDAETGVPD